MRKIMGFLATFIILFMVTACNLQEEFGTLDKEHTDGLKTMELTEEITIFQLDEKQSKRIIITNSDEIKTINKAIKGANKQPGIVDMADPQYKINTGDEIYFLWLSKTDGSIGTIMNFKDTHTIYTLSEAMTNQLKDILFKDN